MRKPSFKTLLSKPSIVVASATVARSMMVIEPAPVPTATGAAAKCSAVSLRL